MRVRSAVVVGLIAALAASSPAGAQRVRGTLTDSTTREPVGGAVVTISDSANTFLARSIADGDGKYSVMRIAGSRRLRIVRIGYRPFETTIGAADSVLDVRMHPVASVLSAVSASGKRICPGDTAAASALEVWEQARAGLLASVVSREAHPPRVRMRTYRRTLEPIRRRTISDTVDIKDVVVDRSFVAARPAWAFAEYGYIRESLGGDREYFAPDEGVMLDETFAARHCLHIIQGMGPRRDEIGIAFDPVNDAAHDTIVDVNGVLWLERGRLALRSIEFHYTNLEREGRDAGGEIWFAVMPNGAPMIERWVIHTPILAVDEEVSPSGVHRSLPPRSMRTARTLGFRDTGGQVGLADWPDGTRWHADLPRVTGQLLDTKGQPVRGAFVWIRDTRDTVRTKSDGNFELPYVFPGIYVVLASDSVLAPEGISRIVAARVGLFTSGDNEIQLLYHPRAEVLPLICPANSYKEGSGVLLARVLDSNGSPAANAQVEVEVSQLLVAGDTIVRPQMRRGEAGEDGRFVICGVDRSRPLVVRAYKAREAAGVSVDQWREEIASVTILLHPPGPQ